MEGALWRHRHVGGCQAPLSPSLPPPLDRGVGIGKERGGHEQVGEKGAVEARALRSCLSAVMCGSDVANLRLA